MDLYQLDVFSDSPYAGNPLAVVPEPADLGAEQMQAIASEMNLSETVFVTSATEDSYSVRIFTPKKELPFAGNPTIGAAWLLRRLGRLGTDRVTQTSRAGETVVTFRDDIVTFERQGVSEDDLTSSDTSVRGRVAKALAVGEDEIGLEARELGRSGFLEPAFADAGLRVLMVPVRDLETLGRLDPDPKSSSLTPDGAYCFTAETAGRIRARGFFPGVGIAEDPGTGSAAGALGIYLAGRIGPVDLHVMQGVEIGRPCEIGIKAQDESVGVSGRCALVMKARMEALP